MQRLSSPPLRRPARDDRGAVSVIVAVLMISLIGCVAIVVDVGAVYADRQQLQTGADAGSLAIAQDCARGSCGAVAATAQTFAAANLNGSGARSEVLSPTPVPATGRVTVRTEVTAQHWFAPVLGIDSSEVGASATATWGAPSGGTALLPLIFSWCEWQAQTGGGQPSGTTPRTILFPKTSATGCTGTDGLFVPGALAGSGPTAAGAARPRASVSWRRARPATARPAAARRPRSRPCGASPCCCRCSRSPAGPGPTPGTACTATPPL